MADQEKRQEVLAWFLAFLLVVFLVTVRPLTSAFNWRPIDYFFSLQVFACFFAPGWRMLLITLVTALIKDALFSLIVTPSLLLGLGLVLVSNLLRGLPFPRKIRWSFPFAGLVYLLYCGLKALCFQLLPLSYQADLGLGERLGQDLAGGLKTLPGIFWGLALVVLVFKLVFPQLFAESWLE